MICPHCKRETMNGMSVSFIDKLIWARCSCGVVFQENQDLVDLSEEYINNFKSTKFFDKSAEYTSKVFFPIIEELVYGRRFLHVDALELELCSALNNRGWITYATSTEEKEKVHILNDKFEDIKNEPIEKFDCIFLYHYIEKKNIDILKKVHNWLKPGGVVLVTTPNTRYIDELGVTGFNHWFKENKILYSRSAIELELKKKDFEVIMVYENTSRRFIKDNDMYIIARRLM